MCNYEVVNKLRQCFPGGELNALDKFIAHKEAGQYFMLKNCKTEEDVKAKLLEWFSRPSFKTAPFDSDHKNREFNDFMLNGVNKFLGTSFTKDDMETIYIKLGNGANHQLTLEFIRPGYKLQTLSK